MGKDTIEYLNTLVGKWVRTCQECFHKQEDKEPIGEMSDAYRVRVCKKCKSESLDYGSKFYIQDTDFTN